MKSGENSDSIPTDLILDILSRLPAKSIGRFSCVSKQWELMLHSPSFTELFLTRSSACPRLLFAVEQRLGEWSFYSSPQPQYTHEKSSSSLGVAAKFHTKFVSKYIVSYACGLIYFPKMWIQKENKEAERVICNPITGQYTILPELRADIDLYSFLGFDPIDKQFKLLVMNTYPDSVHHILTLGNGNMRWRKVQCPFPHEPFKETICINGVLYCLARHSVVDLRSYVIVCFDVRSETFKLLNEECVCDLNTKLINYKGKLCAIRWEFAYHNTMGRYRKLCMWVLEDVEKHEWSKYVYTLPKDKVIDYCYLSIVGGTATGEIVLLEQLASKPYVFFFYPERNTLQVTSCNHQVLERRRVCVFVDHVEDLNFDIMKTTHAATSISPPEQKPKPTSISTRKDHQLEDEWKDHSLKLSSSLSDTSQSPTNYEELKAKERKSHHRRCGQWFCLQRS